MTINPVEVFAVYAEDDNGRRAGLAGVCATRSYAEIVAKGKGSWGSNGQIESRKAIILANHTAYLLERAEPLLLAEHREEVEEIRKQRVAAALAKLSDDDKEILGLGEA